MHISGWNEILIDYRKCGEWYLSVQISEGTLLNKYVAMVFKKSLNPSLAIEVHQKGILVRACLETLV